MGFTCILKSNTFPVGRYWDFKSVIIDSLSKVGTTEDPCKKYQTEFLVRPMTGSSTSDSLTDRQIKIKRRLLHDLNEIYFFLYTKLPNYK